MCTLKAYWEFKAEKSIVSNIVWLYTVLVLALAVWENRSNSEVNIFAKCCDPVI